jgi:hypothetical protein
MIAERDRRHTVGDELVDVGGVIALAHVRATPVVQRVVDEQRALAPKRREALGQVRADRVPRRRVGEVEVHGLEVGMRPARDADDLRVRPRAVPGERLADP